MAKLARVNQRTGTPINATVILVSATAIIVFFTELHILGVLLSISTLFLFGLVALALFVRRYYVSGVTTKFGLIKFVVFIVIIILSSVASAVYWTKSEGWVEYVVTVPLWLVWTMGIRVLVPEAKKPKVRVTFVPCASIGINIFLPGSIDTASFKRFGLWAAILLVYYFFIGLHASYDVAKALKEKKMKLEDKTQLKLDEENAVLDSGESFETS